MKNKECEIVKDLSLGYIEETLNKHSKEYVEEHLSSCDSCKEYYQFMKDNIAKDAEENQKDDNTEISYLKKVRKHINWLKLIIIMIVLVIAIIGINLFVNYNRINNIFEKAYNQLGEMKKSDNYKMVKRTLSKANGDDNFSEDVALVDYYKDGKYRKEIRRK